MDLLLVCLIWQILSLYRRFYSLGSLTSFCKLHYFSLSVQMIELRSWMLLNSKKQTNKKHIKEETRERGQPEKDFSDINGSKKWHTGLDTHLGAAAAKSLQSCRTLCDSMDCSPPGSPVPGILQARTLEWVAISFYNAWKWSRSVVSDSSRPPWTAAHQAPPSMGFSRQEYWSGVPLPSLT